MASKATRLTADALYQRLQGIRTDNPLCSYSFERCEHLLPQIERILELKERCDAVILAHSYVHPDIIYGVADHVGDSYGLAKNALESNRSTIVFPAVRFMAETAKILNPEKRVIDPNPNGGCSLADSISAADVWRLREQFPDHCFMCYINTTAEVKAACDVCVTSSNVYRIVEAVPEKKIYFLPDQLMGQNIQNYVREQGLDKEVRCYHGTCYVHEEFNPSHVDLIRKQHPGAKVLVHPECKPDVVEKADCVDSTSGMLNYVRAHAHENRPFMLLTECGLINRLQVELPEAELVGTCFMCKYMKSNSLSLIEQALESPTAQQEITLDETVRQGALRCIENMFYYAEAACATG